MDRQDRGNRVSLELINEWLVHVGLSRARKLSQMSRGDVNQVYLLDDQFVLSLNTRDPEDRRFADEAAAYNELEAQRPELPVPRLVKLDGNREVLPYDAILTTYLPGVDAASVWQELEPTNRTQVVRQLALFLISQYEVRFDNFGGTGASGKPVFATWKAYLSARTDQVVDCHLEVGAIDVELLIDVQSRLEQLVEGIHEPEYPALLHNDVSIWNMKLTRQGDGPYQLAGLFDYEWCIAGDPLYDLTRMFANEDHGLDDEDAFWGTYWAALGGVQPPPDLRRRQRCYALLYHLELLAVAGQHRGAGSKQWKYHERAVHELVSF